jgi:hypothetical protein
MSNYFNNKPFKPTKVGIIKAVGQKIISTIKGKGKVSPTIKSVKPNFKKTGKQTREDEYDKRVGRVVKSKEKMAAGKKMMREAQKELKKEVDTKKAFKYKKGNVFPIRPGEDMKSYKGLIEEDKPTKKFKTGKQLEAEEKAKAREKKMGGGMMGRRMGYSRGNPKPKTNVQKIKETFAPKGLKKIDPKKQKGLAKLKKARPDVVRKMGYFKRGGRS